MSIDLEQFHQVFFEESFEGLEIIEQALLTIDISVVDADIINSIFRAAHSIKGGSGTFGFEEVTDFTHLVETYLDEVRDGKRALTDQTVDLLLKSCDCLRLMMESLQNKTPIDPENAAPLVEEFNRILSESTEQMNADQNLPSDSSPQSDKIINGMIDNLVAESETDERSNAWCIKFVPETQILLSGNEPVRIFRELAALGELTVETDLTKLPPFNELVVDECYLSWVFQLNSSCSKSEIEEVFDWVIDECSLSIEQLNLVSATSESQSSKSSSEESLGPVMQSSAVDLQDAAGDEVVSQGAPTLGIESPQNDGRNPEKNSEPKKTNTAASSIRVGIDKVDSLINLVGELVITQSMLTELGSNFEMEKVDRLSSGLEQLLQNTKELQESVMRIRMLPISFVFNRFPRMIRDLANKTQKKVELVMAGENTELDKTVMEQIGDPLVHLVRNAIDHGIEPTEVRAANQKPESGVIKLDAYHQGGNIVIEIKDDGYGIDPQIIYKKAAEKGVIKGTETLSDSQVFDLIFEPGFSTAEVVSDISGRGVGMDVVRRNINSLGGQIEIESKLGEGTTFRIFLPLTLAILDGQLVRVGSEIYVVPLISIVESLQIKREQINKVAGNMVVYRLREDNVPIVPLYAAFDIAAENKALDDGLLVVVESGGQKIGILVDDLLAQQQVVVKSLEHNYQRVRGISGATILGDGSVSLILDIPGLINFAGSPASGSPKHHEAA